MGWLAIPGVALAAFVYCGLMKCAEGTLPPETAFKFNVVTCDFS